jgi:hypothetical protein
MTDDAALEVLGRKGAVLRALVQLCNRRRALVTSNAEAAMDVDGAAAAGAGTSDPFFLSVRVCTPGGTVSKVAVDGICLTFEDPASSHPLLPGGEDKAVTDGSPEEYCNLMTRNLLRDGAAVQEAAFSDGLDDVLPDNALAAFTPVRRLGWCAADVVCTGLR